MGTTRVPVKQSSQYAKVYSRKLLWTPAVHILVLSKSTSSLHAPAVPVLDSLVKHFTWKTLQTSSTLTRWLLMLWGVGGVRDLFLPSNHNHMKVETWIGALDGNGDDTRRPWRFYLWWVTVVWLGHLLQGYLDHLFSYQTVNCANPSTRSQPNNWRTNGEPCTWWFDKKGGVISFKKLKRGVQ